jgi:glycosyltransferase involved in cell wall biosynthesis
VNIAVVDYGWIPNVDEPDALLDQMPSLTAWCDALLHAGAAGVTVAQRFARDARIARAGVDYLFCGSVAGLHRIVRQASPDVAHVNGLRFPLQTWRLRHAVPGVPIVVQDHAAGDPAPALTRALSMRKAVWKRGLHAADAFLFTAAAQADAWKAAGLIGQTQPVFGVLESSTMMRPRPREEARIASGLKGAPAVLWVGRLNPNKDPLTVLGGFEIAARAYPDAHLTMVYGDGGLLPAVRDRIACSDVLRSRVTLAGTVPYASMASYFSAADVFVLGSHHEGSGFALLEACACGALPIVSDIPPFRAIAEGAGRFWRVGDAASCGDQLRRAFDDPQAGGARARVIRHFDAKLSWPVVGLSAMAAYAAISGRA